MSATYLKGSTGDTWGFQGKLTITPSASQVSCLVGAFSSTTSVGQVLSSTSKRVFELYADTGAAALTTDAQIVNARLVLLPGVDQTGAGAASVLRGHLRIAGADLTNSESKEWAGVAGYVESDGTHTIGGSYLTIAAALSGTVEIGGTPTLAANGITTGLHLTSKWTAAFSPSGEHIGIYFQANVQGFEHAFGFSGVGTTDGNGVSTGSDSTNVTHKIAIYIGGVGTRYLHVFSD